MKTNNVIDEKDFQATEFISNVTITISESNNAYYYSLNPQVSSNNINSEDVLTGLIEKYHKAWETLAES